MVAWVPATSPAARVVLASSSPCSLLGLAFEAPIRSYGLDTRGRLRCLRNRLTSARSRYSWPTFKGTFSLHLRSIGWVEVDGVGRPNIPSSEGVIGLQGRTNLKHDHRGTCTRFARGSRGSIMSSMMLRTGLRNGPPNLWDAPQNACTLQWIWGWTRNAHSPSELPQPVPLWDPAGILATRHHSDDEQQGISQNNEALQRKKIHERRDDGIDA